MEHIRARSANDAPTLGRVIRLPGAVVAAAVVMPEQVADEVPSARRAGRFLVLQHPKVSTFEQQRAEDRARWPGGMRSDQASPLRSPGESRWWAGESRWWAGESRWWAGESRWWAGEPRWWAG